MPRWMIVIDGNNISRVVAPCQVTLDNKLCPGPGYIDVVVANPPSRLVFLRI
jgi:hypothetical protein